MRREALADGQSPADRERHGGEERRHEGDVGRETGGRSHEAAAAEDVDQGSAACAQAQWASRRNARIVAVCKSAPAIAIASSALPIAFQS